MDAPLPDNRRPDRPRGFEGVGDVLRRWEARTRLMREPRGQVWEAWATLLGRDAGHTRLESLRGGTAVFSVDSSPLLMELGGFRKQELLDGLASALPGRPVREIRLKLLKETGPGKGPRRR